MDPNVELLREQQLQITGKLRSQAVYAKLYLAKINEQSMNMPIESSLCGCSNKNLLGTPPSNLTIARSSRAPDFVSTARSLVTFPTKVDGRNRNEGYVPTNPESTTSDVKWNSVGKAGSGAQGPMVSVRSDPTRQYAGVPKGSSGCCLPNQLPVPAVKVREVVPRHSPEDPCTDRDYVVQKTDTSVQRASAQELQELSVERKIALKDWLNAEKIEEEVAQEKRNPFVYSYDPLTNSVPSKDKWNNFTPKQAEYSYRPSPFRVTTTLHPTHRLLVPPPVGLLDPRICPR